MTQSLKDLQTQLEAANRKIEELENIIAALPGHVYWKDRNGILLGSNINNWKDFGAASLEEFLGKTDYELFPKQEADRIREIDNEVISTDKLKVVEEVSTVENGQRLYLSHKTPLKNKEGHIIGVLGVSIDITKAKQEVEDRLDLLENIINLMPGHVYWKDNNFVNLGCNTNNWRDYGLRSLKDYQGTTDYDLFTKETADHIRKVDEEVVKNGRALIIEEPNLHSDGTKIMYLSNKQPLYNRRKEMLGIVGISIDITEIKRLEQEKITLELEKIQAQKKLYDTAAQVAHDIRSPLVALDVVLKEMAALPEAQRNIIRSATQRINDIANNLITTYSKSETCLSSFINPELVFGLLDSILSEKRTQYKHRNIEFNLNMPQAYGIFVNVNPVEFKRALSNLINNAVEAISHKGKIDLHVNQFDGQVGLVIQDNGCGIPADLLPKITQSGITVGKKGGAGLGLTYAIDKIDEWQGHYTITSEVGKVHALQ